MSLGQGEIPISNFIIKLHTDFSVTRAAQDGDAQNGGIRGAIIGRALYDGRIDPAAALALVSAKAAVA